MIPLSRHTRISIAVLLITLFAITVPPALAQPAFPAVQDPAGFKFSGMTLGAVISQSLPYVFAIAGLAMFLYVLWSGFQYLLSQGNAKTVEESRNKLLHAIVGFVVVFASYWIVQIIETILGVSIFK